MKDRTETLVWGFAFVAGAVFGAVLPGCAPRQIYSPFDSYLRVRDAFGKLCWSGCGAVSVESDANTSLASTWIIERGNDVIVFNETEMQLVGERYGEQAVFGIFAHEYGHHLDFSLEPKIGPWSEMSRQESWRRELIADRWSGCAMATAGVWTEPYVHYLETAAREASHTHPPGPMRSAEALEGSRACR